ncbi:MAG: photosystem II reaction center protein PsbN [Roseofilum sp. SBFL]|nr:MULTISPECIES: photosystem II reaction center protein PsbN [unclassified Roseofilum]MBP0013192.1 photosystem II reaction center protein PsbN [Roseofilum sp. SID3]MBP0023231.1 photosystem II reaction center protein PsbN [Roseofilum sp. SID2]MBP0039406.1 photosystem II reaction center protein PsbN [Roseofilum sp. SID1]MBP0044071.1 photosystem II reaction center protein PsbN [Roseofilum sp. SBFL]
METATVLNIGIVAIVLALTCVSLYTSFGPPSEALDDPFEDHED